MGRRHEQTFLQRRHTNGQQAHKKEHSASLGTREIQTKTTMWSHLTPLTRAQIKLKIKLRGTCMFIAAISTIAKIWEEPRCSLTDEWIKMCVYNGILLSHQKEWNLAICNDVDGTRAKWYKSVRERQIPYDFTYMWNLRNKTDEHRGREGKLK